MEQIESIPINAVSNSLVQPGTAPYSKNNYSKGKFRSSLRLIFKPDFMLFALLSLVLWVGFLYVRGGSVSEHSYKDQHTLQALAWHDMKTSITTTEDIELAEYNNKRYVSFPPTPSLIEFPFTFFFNQNTPNVIILLFTTWLAMICSVLIIFNQTKNIALSLMGGLCFFWGSNILYLSLTSAVWNQGQLFGLAFTIFSLALILISSNRLALISAGVCLGLAVGCRPFYLVIGLYSCYVIYKKFNRLSSIGLFFSGLFPILAGFSIYNFIRFQSLIEFGHKYLPWSRSLPNGVFSFHYFGHNLWHALFQPPIWDSAHRLVSFSGEGTSFVLISPFVLLGLVAFFQNKIDRSEKLILALCLITTWSLLLIHESNGWFQFGYRYGIDLIPLLVVMFAKTFKKLSTPLALIGIFSIVANFYGAVWFYLLRTGIS